MADPDRPLFADAQAQLARLAGDLRRMAGLRWQLARLEFDASARRLQRLAILLAAATVMVLTSLPILVVAAARLLPEAARPYFLLAFGAAVLCGGIAGLAAAWRAWGRFRDQRFGLEETLEELREDLVWLEEWIGRGEEEDGTRDEGQGTIG